LNLAQAAGAAAKVAAPAAVGIPPCNDQAVLIGLRRYDLNQTK
jgi:hypothetical protein